MIYELAILLLLPILNSLRKRKKSSPDRILVIQVAKIGDFINSSILISALRDNFPESKISVLVSPVNKKIAECDPIIDQVYVSDPGGYHGFYGRMNLARVISNTDSDTVFSLNCISAISVACVWARVPQRFSVSINKKSISILLNRNFWDGQVIHKPERLIHQTYNDLLELCNASVGQHHFSTRIYMDESESISIDDRFPRAGNQYIGIGISSANKLKELSLEKMLSLIKNISRKYNFHILLIGSENDKEKAEQLAYEGARISVVAGDYSIEQIPYLMHRLRLFVGVDSGLTYMADALSIPVVSISGPCNMSETRPLGKRTRLVQNMGLSCMPCSYIHNTARSCSVGTLDCINSISVEEIMDAISELVIV